MSDTMMNNPDDQNSVLSWLATLETQERDVLAARWQVVFGCPAPRHSQATFLRSALAWHWQMGLLATANRPSGAKVDVDNAIRRVQRRLRHSANAGLRLAPGTHLLREWQGRTHQVTVLSSGFEYQGQVYTSLSAIARLITGTAWSGPRFFGLRP